MPDAPTPPPLPVFDPPEDAPKPVVPAAVVPVKPVGEDLGPASDDLDIELEDGADRDEELAAKLNPSAVLSGGLSREELIRQAAEAGGQPLIVPEVAQQIIAEPTPEARAGAKVQEVDAKVQAESLAGVPMSSRPPTPAVVAPLATTAQLLPERPVGVPPTFSVPADRDQAPLGPPRRPPAFPPGQAPAVRTGAAPAALSAPKKRRSAVPILIGSFLVLIGGALTLVAAIGAARIPVLTPLFSGLPSSGKEVLTKATQAVASSSELAMTGIVTLELSSGTAGVQKLSLETKRDQLGVRTSNGQAAPVTITVDGTKTEAVLAEQTGSREVYRVAFPGLASTEDANVSDSELKSTVLGALRIPSPETLLAASGAVVSHGVYKGSDATYDRITTSPDATALVEVLPGGATLKNATLTHYVAWKSARLSVSQLQAILVYGDIEYKLVVRWNYSGYGAPVSAPQEAIELLSATELENLTAEAYGALLGIRPGDLPTLDASPQPSGSPTPSASPVPTASTTPFVSPSASPSVVASPRASSSAGGTSAVTPRNGGITSPRTEVTASPPAPLTVPDAAALDRDRKRKQDLADIQAALEAHKKANGSYPSAPNFIQLSASQAFFTAMLPTFLTAVPVDPTPDVRAYSYRTIEVAGSRVYVLRAILENGSDPDGQQAGAQRHYLVTGR